VNNLHQEYKVYVQTRLAQNKDAVCALLVGGTYVYLSGSAKRMPADVREALRDILRASGKMSVEEAEKVLKALERSKRYVVESWA
jgi:sulfite reductase alpha subunit-like flavoprotein